MGQFVFFSDQSPDKQGSVTINFNDSNRKISSIDVVVAGLNATLIVSIVDEPNINIRQVFHSNPDGSSNAQNIPMPGNLSSFYDLVQGTRPGSGLILDLTSSTMQIVCTLSNVPGQI